jgi:anti-sigma B factor antagonist
LLKEQVMGETDAGPRAASTAGPTEPEQGPILRCAVVNDRDGLTVLVEGELDVATAPDLYAELERLLALEPRALAVDLSRLTFIDSTGISALHTIREHAQSCGVPFALQAPSSAVERVLEVTALWEHFDTRSSRFEDEGFEW